MVLVRLWVKEIIVGVKSGECAWKNFDFRSIPCCNNLSALFENAPKLAKATLDKTIYLPLMQRFNIDTTFFFFIYIHFPLRPTPFQ